MRYICIIKWRIRTGRLKSLMLEKVAETLHTNSILTQLIAREEIFFLFESMLEGKGIEW